MEKTTTGGSIRALLKAPLIRGVFWLDASIILNSIRLPRCFISSATVSLIIVVAFSICKPYSLLFSSSNGDSLDKIFNGIGFAGGRAEKSSLRNSFKGKILASNPKSVG